MSDQECNESIYNKGYKDGLEEGREGRRHMEICSIFYEIKVKERNTGNWKLYETVATSKESEDILDELTDIYELATVNRIKASTVRIFFIDKDEAKKEVN